MSQTTNNHKFSGWHSHLEEPCDHFSFRSHCSYSSGIQWRPRGETRRTSFVRIIQKRAPVSLGDVWKESDENESSLFTYFTYFIFFILLLGSLSSCFLEFIEKYKICCMNNINVANTASKFWVAEPLSPTIEGLELVSSGLPLLVACDLPLELDSSN